MLKTVLHFLDHSEQQIAPFANQELVPRIFYFFFYWGFTPFRLEQPLKNMDLQEKQEEKDKKLQKSYIEKTQ